MTSAGAQDLAQLEVTLRDFRERCAALHQDQDEEMVQLLERMERETRLLRRAEWSRPGNHARTCNTAAAGVCLKPPEADDTYRRAGVDAGEESREHAEL